MISSKSSNVDAKTEFIEPIRCESKVKYKKDATSDASGVLQETQIHGSQSTIRSIYMNCVIIGNPFLGYRVNVTKAFLNKHKLSLGQSYWFDHGDRTILHEALTTFPNAVDITAGGETLNIALAAQNICSQAKSIVVMGVKATDDESVLLTKSLREVPLSLRFEEKKAIKTNVDSSIYMMPEAAKKLAYYASASFKVFCASLYNVSLMSLIKDDLKSILAYTDVLFLTKHVRLL
ncbi:hypothetical protein Btru_013308 [Bulinus truncatus]|nr:hypothetical protein Btru_013308 [Bulinus truncatus]